MPLALFVLHEFATEVAPAVSTLPGSGVVMPGTCQYGFPAPANLPVEEVARVFGACQHVRVRIHCHCPEWPCPRWEIVRVRLLGGEG